MTGDAAPGTQRPARQWDAYILAGIAIQNERGALSVAEKRGEQRGREEGLRQGMERGREERLWQGEEGLRQAVELLCDVLGIELTDERRREFTNLDVEELMALLVRLREQRRWI